ncbi:hypothetical protein HHI36_002538 [Cryptolaemus montrouzieri]|uniref:GyrI-like small molecule binding domain-containing protein n=1 Tax=Cryptolaemus montrouzieri TaxID=559131 RepID=A0ABD2PBL3_9CUCU
MINVNQHIPFNVVSAETFENNAYIHIKIPPYKVNIIAVYKQPKASEKNSLEKMENVLNVKNAICLGDFEICLLDKKPIYKEYISIVLSKGYETKNSTKMDDYTRVYKRTLDHIHVTFVIAVPLD